MSGQLQFPDSEEVLEREQGRASLMKRSPFSLTAFCSFDLEERQPDLITEKRSTANFTKYNKKSQPRMKVEHLLVCCGDPNVITSCFQS